MAKNPVDEKKRIKKLREKIKETKKAAFIKSKSDSEDYEESPEEKRAQDKLNRLEKRLEKVQKK